MVLPKYTVAAVLAVALIATLSAGVVVMNDAVGEMKKMNEPKGPTEVVWPPSPWQVNPNWPSQYNIDWSESNPISITYTKPSWADTVAEKLTLLGGRIYFTDAENLVISTLTNVNVTAEDYMFVITQYPSEHEKETIYVPYEKIERIRFTETV